MALYAGARGVTKDCSNDKRRCGEPSEFKSWVVVWAKESQRVPFGYELQTLTAYAGKWDLLH